MSYSIKYATIGGLFGTGVGKFGALSFLAQVMRVNNFGAGGEALQGMTYVGGTKSFMIELLVNEKKQPFLKMSVAKILLK